jgi:hypothetical protein
MKKSDLNESMLFKLRNRGLCVLLDKNGDKTKVFYNKENIKYGDIGGLSTLSNYNENLTSNNISNNYDIIAIKQYNSCTKVIYNIIHDIEPEEWDWEIKEKVDFITAFNAWFYDNKTIEGVLENDVYTLNGKPPKALFSIGADRIAKGEWYIK